MTSDVVRRLSVALTVGDLIEELGKLPADSLVVFRHDRGGHPIAAPVTDVDELFPDETLDACGVASPLLRVRDAEDWDPDDGSPALGVVVLS